MVERKVESLPLMMCLRGAIFHERGYTFDATGDLSKAMFFFIHDAAGKVVRIERPAWAKDNGDEVIIHLEPYGNPEEAEAALVTMCGSLRLALAGDVAAKNVLALGWLEILRSGIGVFGDDRKALSALTNFCGKARALDVLAGQAVPDPLLMVTEALTGPEPIGVSLGG